MGVCQNNGQCMRNGDDYYCDCFAPWSGQHCDVISDPMSAVSVVNIMQQNAPCDSQPCMNGGTCIRSGLSNDYECFCASGFNGENCENNYADETQQWNNQNQQNNQNNNQNQQNNNNQGNNQQSNNNNNQQQNNQNQLNNNNTQQNKNQNQNNQNNNNQGGNQQNNNQNNQNNN